MNEQEFMKFKKGDFVKVRGRSLNYYPRKDEVVFGYIRETRADSHCRYLGSLGNGEREDLWLEVIPKGIDEKYSAMFNINGIKSMRKLKGERFMSITVKQAVDCLEDTMTDFIVVCNIYSKVFILTWLGSEKGYVAYGFQPMGRTAFQEFGIGISEEDGLKDYLMEQIRKGGFLYYARSVEQMVDAVVLQKRGCLLPEIVADNTHTITIDGKDIEISDKSFKQLKTSLDEK